MTKARGAADSIGKAGRGASFLLPAFSPYYVPYFPLFLRARARTHTPTHVHVHIHSAKYTYIYTRTRVLFPFCPPPPLVPPTPRQPLVLSSSTLHAVLLLPLSSSFRAAFRPLRRRYCTYVCTRAYVCTCASSQSSYARFHVARLRALPRREGGFVRG